MPPEISDADLKALKDGADASKAEAAAAKAEAAAAKAEAEKLKALPPKTDGDKKDPPKDESLLDRAGKAKQTEEEKKAETRAIESVLTFNLGVKSFVDANKDLLPNEIAEVIALSEKEKYDTATEKASAVRAAMVQSFFAVQSNVELLTPSQKSVLDDFLKLTKNGKEQKAASIYENLFEPALESLKRVKKAEELWKTRNGIHSSTSSEDAYKQKLISGSKKSHLGEKGA